MDSQRRSVPRYQFFADCEVEIGNTRLKARTSELSLCGCFVDMLNPTPEGSTLRIVILHGDTMLGALGRVAYILPNIGMGVAFVTIEPSQLAILQKWLADPQIVRLQ
jgi:hypothetical protein